MPSTNASASLLSLPPELLSNIAALSSPDFADAARGDRHSLAQLRLTSRKLKEVATPLFWHTVTIPAHSRRGSLGHSEAFARLMRMSRDGTVDRPMELVKDMLFMVPDTTFLLSAALLGSFANLQALHLDVVRPDRFNLAISTSITQGLADLLHLNSLHLDGFTSIIDASFTLASLPSLRSLTLTNCEGLSSIFGPAATVSHLRLNAVAEDRPIDISLTASQWNALESLALEGSLFSDFFTEPGILPKQLVESLTILDKSPARLRHLELDSFTVMNDPRAQALLDKLADGSITSVRFVAYRGRSCFDELYGALPLLSKIMKLQIDDFDWTEETMTFRPFIRLLDSLPSLRTLTIGCRTPTHVLIPSHETVLALLRSTDLLDFSIVSPHGVELLRVARRTNEDEFAVYT